MCYDCEKSIINENITWNPRTTSWLLTLEDISDALAVIGYKVDVPYFKLCD